MSYKYVLIIKRLRANPDAVCITYNEEQRDNFPEDIRDQVFVKNLPSDYLPKSQRNIKR